MILVATLTLLAGLTFPGLLRPLLRRWRLVDTPNHRSSHTEATLRGGGLAVAASVLAGLVLAGALGIISWPFSAALMVAPISLAILGFVEDRFGLSVRGRLGLQFLLSALGSLAVLAALGAPIWLALPLGLVGVFTINAANFMDGVNGISSFEGVALGSTALAVGLIEGSPATATVGLVAAVSFVGFLPWNFPTARMFLGDSGSYLLGALALVSGTMAWYVSGSLLAAVAPFSIYAADVLATLFVRATRGEDLTASHREHGYQQLSRQYGNHAVPAVVTFGATCLVSALAVASIVRPGFTVWAWVLGLVVVGAYLAVGFRSRSRNRVAGRV